MGSVRIVVRKICGCARIQKPGLMSPCVTIQNVTERFLCWVYSISLIVTPKLNLMVRKRGVDCSPVIR